MKGHEMSLSLEEKRWVGAVIASTLLTLASLGGSEVIKFAKTVDASMFVAISKPHQSSKRCNSTHERTFTTLVGSGVPP